MAKVWEPSRKVWETIHSTHIEIRGRMAGDLYDKVTFKVHNELFGMAGITFHKNHVAIARKVTIDQHYASYKYQSVVIFHELDHVAQQEDWGWVGFMGTYGWEWLRSGFNYQNMKKRGIEKEAIEITKEFANSINYRIYEKVGDKLSLHYGWEESGGK